MVDLSLERALLGAHGAVLGLDEVGRGALAGPLVVGAALLTSAPGEPPVGLADSKVLTARRRDALVGPVEAWARCAVGVVTPAEIDELGMSRALRLAAERAASRLGEPAARCAVIVDGPYDWVGRPEPSPRSPGALAGPVTTRVKADRDCALVAAASVVAKVYRDRVMRELDQHYPGYGFARHVGYGTRDHRDALARRGPCPEHRLSFRLGPVEPRA